MKTYKVEITEDFIKEAHAVACSEWKTKIKNLVPEAFKLEAGKWYKYNNRVFFITEFNKGHAHGYGINNKNTWLDARNVTLDLCLCNKWLVNDLIPASHEEVEEMLTKEAKRRGLVEGVEVRSLSLNSIDKINRNIYFLHDNSFFVNNGIFENICIMKDGVWAKPIKNETSQRIEKSIKEAHVLKRIEDLETELEKLKSEL